MRVLQHPENGLPPRPATRRVVGLVVATGLHVLVIVALISASQPHIIPPKPEPIEVALIEEYKPPKLTAPEIIPKQVQPISKPIQPPTRLPLRLARPNILTSETSSSTVPPPTPVAVPLEKPVAEKQPPMETSADIDPTHSCAAPEYPLAAKRLGQSGTVIVKFLIEEDGSISTSQVVTSSGYARLDEAAREGLSLCHFKPGTVDGKPKQSWAQIQYVWTLNKR